MKSGELLKRSDRRAEAEASLKTATEDANHKDIDKFSRRLVKVSKADNAECMQLLELMGVPVIQAPCEAEAQCAAMARDGLVFATATEDLDALTFGTPILLRYLTFSQARKMPVAEIHLDEVLKGLDLSMQQFRELCILCGCDYTGSIRGIGPQKALNLIKEYGSIDEALKHIDMTKYPIPTDFLYEDARALFDHPEVLAKESVKLEWKDPDEAGLIKFLVDEKQFDIGRVKSGLEKLKDAKKKSSQQRLESYFGAPIVTKRKASSSAPEKKAAKKRGKKADKK
jgi:flap endonuclease-1